jgi:hypothetical protein
LGVDAPFERIVARVASDWAIYEPPELAFVPAEVAAAARERRHESIETTLLDRVERGQLTAIRRIEDGEIVYLPSELVAVMDAAERAAFEPYGPMLARALRRHAIESGFTEWESKPR